MFSPFTVYPKGRQPFLPEGQYLDNNISAQAKVFIKILCGKRKLWVLTFSKLVESRYIAQFFCLQQSKSLYGPFAKSLRAILAKSLRAICKAFTGHLQCSCGPFAKSLRAICKVLAGHFGKSVVGHPWFTGFTNFAGKFHFLPIYWQKLNPSTDPLQLKKYFEQL